MTRPAEKDDPRYKHLYWCPDKKVFCLSFRNQEERDNAISDGLKVCKRCMDTTLEHPRPPVVRRNADKIGVKLEEMYRDRARDLKSRLRREHPRGWHDMLHGASKQKHGGRLVPLPDCKKHYDPTSLVCAYCYMRDVCPWRPGKKIGRRVA